MRLARILMVFLFTGILNYCFAQLPQSDNFSGYTVSSDLDGQGNWLGSLPGNNKVKVEALGLNYSYYPFSGSANSVLLGTDREAVGLSFGGDVTSGSVYYSFMFKADSTSESGSAIVSLSTQSASDRFAVLYLKDAGSSWQIGLRKSTLGLPPAYASNALAKTDTHVVVVKYTFRTGDGQDDSLRMWVDPDLSAGTEPAPDVAILEGVTPDAPNFQYFELIEQEMTGVNNEADSTYLYLDGVRVAATWSEAPMPVQLVAFNARANRLDVNLRWSTATEVNNFGFDVERRAVGEESWRKVGFVQGWGTSTEPREYYYADAGLSAGRYAYRIKQIDLDGSFSYFTATEVEVGVAAKELALEPNYPNPFNPATQISFSVPEDGKAVLKVYNMLGQEVAVLFDEVAEAGKLYQKTFDASSLPTGVYVSRLEYGGRSVMRKMLFVK